MSATACFLCYINITYVVDSCIFHIKVYAYIIHFILTAYQSFDKQLKRNRQINNYRSTVINSKKKKMQIDSVGKENLQSIY